MKRVISTRTWMLGGVTLFFLALILYCLWRTGWGPSWLPRVHAQDTVGRGFVPDRCDMWREMPFLDKFAAGGLFASGIAFFISLAQDLWRFWKRRRLSRV